VDVSKISNNLSLIPSTIPQNEDSTKSFSFIYERIQKLQEMGNAGEVNPAPTPKTFIENIAEMGIVKYAEYLRIQDLKEQIKFQVLHDIDLTEKDIEDMQEKNVDKNFPGLPKELREELEKEIEKEVERRLTIHLIAEKEHGAHLTVVDRAGTQDESLSKDIKYMLGLIEEIMKYDVRDKPVEMEP